MRVEKLKADLEKEIIDPFWGKSVYAQYDVCSDNGVLFHGAYLALGRSA